MSTPSNDSGRRRRTVSSSPRNSSLWPSLRSEASGTSSDTGNSRSSSTLSISLPTAPVAPATATFTLRMSSLSHLPRCHAASHSVKNNGKPITAEPRRARRIWFPSIRQARSIDTNKRLRVLRASAVISLALHQLADAAFAEGHFGGAGLEVVRGKGEAGSLVVPGAAEERCARLGHRPGRGSARLVRDRDSVRPRARAQHDGPFRQPGGEVLRAQHRLGEDQLRPADGTGVQLTSPGL